MTLDKQHVRTPCNLWTKKTIRLQIAFLLCLAMMTCGLLRGHLAMALVCMMRSNLNSTSPEDTYTSSLQVDWSLQNVGTIHTSFYVGTFISVLVAHSLAQSIGAKATITGGIIMNILCAWAFPNVVYFLPEYFYTAMLRFVMGLGQGVFVPCASLLIAKWFPMHEKSTAMAIFSTGNQVGLALAMFATAELCKIRYMDGWPSSFFLYGLIGAAFLGIWLPYVNNKPRESARISPDELLHIEESEYRLRAMSMNLRIPYKTLFCSPVILAICLSSFCQSFVMVSMISYLPEYYRSVLKLGISANGQWSSIPFLIQMFSKMGFAFSADYLKLHGFKINFVTKTCNSIASFGCALCLFGVCFVTNGTLIMVLLCLGLTLTSAFVPGYNTSIVSVAPAYTAVVSSYAQIYAQLASIIAPLMVGHFAVNSTAEEWRLVFMIIAGTCVVTGIFFQYFGQATIQPWATSMHQSCSLSTMDNQNASTFTIHNLETAGSYMSLHHSGLEDTREPLERQSFISEASIPSTTNKFLTIPGRINRRSSPRVSIMEGDEIVRPGDDDEM